MGTVVPGCMARFSCGASNNSPVWSVFDFLRWKIVPDRLGGGRTFIRRFKDGWVKHNRVLIVHYARSNKIPAELLAGTAWIEVGGDPTFVDRMAYEVRSLDWSGPKWVDDRLTLTREPSFTSFGAVSMQLRAAARTMRIDLRTLSAADLRSLARCLERDVFNLDIVARHLRDLTALDFPGSDARNLNPDQIKIVGARYNRGTSLSLDAIKNNMSYGEFIVKMWPHLTGLLNEQ